MIQAERGELAMARTIRTANGWVALMGYVAATFAPILAKVISFTVLDTNDAYGYADGALAGVGIAPVPVPAAGLLMVGGLGGLAALRRRKKA